MNAASPDADLQDVRTIATLLAKIRSREASSTSDTVYFPAGYEKDLLPALAERASQRLCRTSLWAGDPTEADDFADAVWNELAEMGVSVRQVYVVSHLGLLDENARHRMLAGTASGTDVRVVTASALPEDLASGARDQLVLDDRILAIAPTRSSSSSSWTVTVRRALAAGAVQAFDKIWELASPFDSLPEQFSLEEPLVQSAPLLARVAPVLCSGDHIDNSDCSWYHGVWQYLRLMNMVSTPTWHQNFYSEELLQRLRDPSVSAVCVTGTADYSVFAFIVDAIKSVGKPVTVTVVDLCQTPLFAIQWYAKRAGVTVTTVAQDIFEFFGDHENQYDLVVTDAFLTRFPGQGVDRILDGWGRILRPGGCVITTIRVHASSDRAQSVEEAVGSFRARARRNWERWEAFIPDSADDVAARAELYARRMITNPIGSVPEVVERVESRFTVLRDELADVPGELYPTRYLRLLLKKDDGS